MELLELHFKYWVLIFTCLICCGRSQLLQPACTELSMGLNYFDMKLPPVQLPASKTTYICQEFQIPEFLTNRSVHAVAFSPLIGNKAVLHHMLLFGCHLGSLPADDEGPHRCNDNSGQTALCRSYLNVWSVGFNKTTCLHPDAGIKLGKDGFTVLSLQVHLNNDQLLDNLTDNSGIRVYYTEIPRVHELGNVQIGQSDLEIPPKVTEHAHSGGCSGECTGSLVTQPIYLTRAFLHMHQLGTSAKLELFRNGTLVTEVTTNPSYNYGSPVSDQLHNPVKVYPGDEVKLTCWFDSTNGAHQRNKTVYFGEGVDGEMCYAFVSYYPKMKDFDQCVQFDKYDMCHSYNAGEVWIGDCIPRVFAASHRANIRFLESDCTTSSVSEPGLCQKRTKLILEEPCMKGRSAVYLRTQYLRTVNWQHIHGLVNTLTKVV